MRILFYDYIQLSDAPGTLKSPSLSDRYNISSVYISLDTTRTFDCIGVGYTDATSLTVNGETITLANPSPYPQSYKNGLYILSSSQTTDAISMSHNGSYLGRFACGVGHEVGCSPAREPGFYSTHQDRDTASMSVIPGAGGVTGRKIQVDFRYKFTEAMFNDIELAYPQQIGRGYPLFIVFDKETHRMPWDRLYGKPTDKDLLFQSSVNRFLYSRLFNFTEAY